MDIFDTMGMIVRTGSLQVKWKILLRLTKVCAIEVRAVDTIDYPNREAEGGSHEEWAKYQGELE